MGDQDIIKEISDEIGKASDMIGLPNSIGKVWSTLYFNKGMTQEELSGNIGCSVGSVSQAINFLERVGLIYASGKDGRKHIYTAEADIQKVKKIQMENALRFYISPMCDLLNSRASAIQDKDLKNKVNKLKNFYSKTGFVMNVILKTPFGKCEK